LNDWEDLVYVTAERFGGVMPHPDTAAAIARVHQRAPHAVEAAIDRVAAEHEEGTVRSPWGMLKSRVAQIQADIPQAERRNTRQDDIERAEQWVKVAGIYLDWPEVESELFDPEQWTPPLEYLQQLEAATRDRPGRPIYNTLLLASIEYTAQHGPQRIPESTGKLRDHDTPELREQFRELWWRERPRGVQAELEAEERGQRNQQHRARLAAKPQPQPDAGNLEIRDGIPVTTTPAPTIGGPT
jgi:hypothetical protein